MQMPLCCSVNDETLTDSQTDNLTCFFPRVAYRQQMCIIWLDFHVRSALSPCTSTAWLTEMVPQLQLLGSFISACTLVCSIYRQALLNVQTTALPIITPTNTQTAPHVSERGGWYLRVSSLGLWLPYPFRKFKFIHEDLTARTCCAESLNSSAI